MIEEIDRSTSVRLPDDRPLTHSEGMKLWVDHVPEIVRRGRCDTSTNSIERQLAQAWGWLINRLYWDDIYLRCVRQEMHHEVLARYTIPDVCKPGGRYVSRKYLDRLRHEMFDGADFHPFNPKARMFAL